MGAEHRLTAGFALGVALLSCVACGRQPRDGSEAQARRRALLRAEDLAQKQRAELEQRRVVTPDSELIASDERVAGLLLPRGLTLRRAGKDEWIYTGVLALPALERYLLGQLEGETITRPNPKTVQFANGTPKGKPEANTITVRIHPETTNRALTQLSIREHVPAPRRNAVEIQTEIDARRAHAM